MIAGYHQDGLRQVNMQLWNWRGIDVINAHERDPRVYISGMHAAANAIACVHSGSVWTGEHGQAAAYLERAAGTEGAAAARQLRRLMPLKNRTEYDPVQLSEIESAGAVEAARRIVSVAERAVQV